MAELKGTNVAGTVVPFTTEDSFPTHDSIYGKGGWREVSTSSERDAISSDRLSIGMAVYVTSEDKLYIYKGDGAWEEFISGITGVAWGDVTGNLSDQTDLNDALTELSDKIEDNKTNIENLVSRVTTNEQNIVTLDENKAERSELQAEITNRENADNDLSDKIDSVEDDLTEDIDSLTTIVENNYTALDNRITSNATAISQETTARQNADSDLQDQIDTLSARGRFLALWNCAEGKPTSEPDYDEAYTYKTGDYFIVSAIGDKNYKPTGTTYTKGQAASTVEETDEVAIDDSYYFDGASWHLQANHGKTVSFANLAGDPTDNTALSNALNAKQDVLTQGANINITTGEDGTVTISATDTTYSQGTGITIDNNNQISVTDYNTIVSNASAGANAATTISGYGDIVTHNASEFATPSDIPTKTSDLENDSGFITSDYHDNTKQDILNSSDTIIVADNVLNTNNIVWRKW